MRDYWPYLASKHFMERFEKAISMIGSVKDKIILDLNCGRAGMLKYLPEDFKLYIGNDINEDFLKIAKKWKTKKNSTIFILCRDDEIMDYLSGVDIFMCFGINSGQNKGIESETEFETFKKVVEKFLPEVVVCEIWKNYENCLIQRADFLKPFNYKEVGEWSQKISMLRSLKVYRREQ